MKIARRWKWILLPLIAVLVLQFETQLAWLGRVIAQEVSSYPLNVNKYALDTSGSVQTKAKPGDVVNYVIDYRVDPKWQGTGPSLANLQFVDTISSDMELQGQLRKPALWSAADGGATPLRFSIPLLIPGVESSVSPNSAAIMKTASGGGDGFAPIIYHKGDGSKHRFFEIYHHSAIGSGAINCQDYFTGASCAGYPKSLTTGANKTTADIGTALVPRTAQVGDQLFYPAVTNGEGGTAIGIGCWNMSTDTACTYIALASGKSGSQNSHPGGVVASPRQPGKVFATFGGTLFCYDAVANARCLTEQVIPATNAGVSDLIALDQYLFVHSGTRTTCWDVSTLPGTKCSSAWPRIVSGATYYNLHPSVDAQGRAAGVCNSIGNGSWASTSVSHKCWDVLGNAATTPTILNKYTTIYSGASAHLPGSSKVYYPVAAINGKTNGRTLCWDFSKNAECNGFTDGADGAATGIRRWNERNQGKPAGSTSGVIGETRDYGYMYDNGCMYGLGDTGILWSFDPDTGNAPCVKMHSVIKVPDPSPFCDGLDHGVVWDRVELNNTPAQMQSIALAVYDAATCTGDVEACTPIATGQAAASALPTSPVWTIPFETPVSYKKYPSLLIKLGYRFVNNTAPTDYGNFSIRTLYKTNTENGPIGQVCATAKVLACPASQVDNLATILSAQGAVLGRGFAPLTTPSPDLTYSDSRIALSSNVLSADTRAYHATYRRTDWSGELTAYALDPATGAVDESAALWKASTKLPSFEKPDVSRNIYTANATGTPIAFTHDALSESQRPYFGSTKQEQQDVIAYLKGSQQYEVGRAPNNMFRYRSKVLGDVIHSNPLYYRNMVYVQANDGMLHAFDAESGKELFAYIPSAVLPHLSALSSVGYKHQYLMDGQVAAATVNGRHLLIGSTAGVAPAIFGLDVSSLPGTPDGVVQWEKTSDYLGQAGGDIHIAKLPNGPTVALIANGMGSPRHSAALLVVNLETGAITAIDTGSGTAASPNGLSAPALAFERGVLKAVYAGDMQGNLWRFSLASAASGSASKLFSGDPLKPVSAAPSVSDPVLLSGQSGFMVYFGTGKPLDRRDRDYDPTVPSETAAQTFYGLFDQNASAGTIRESDLVAQSFSEQEIKIGDETINARVMSKNAVDYKTKKGWYLPLAAGGERVISRPHYRDARVSFLTAIPYRSRCGDASVTSWFMELDGITGGQTTSQVFDRDFDKHAPIVNGLAHAGTTVDAVDAVGNRKRTNITSTAESEGNGKRTSKELTKTPAGTLIRTSWRQLF